MSAPAPPLERTAAPAAEGPRPAATSRRRLPGLPRRARAVVLPVVVLTLWQLAPAAGLADPSLLPPPSTVVATLWSDALDGSLWDNASISILRWVAGFFLGATTGVLLGAIVGLYLRAEDYLDTSVQMFRTVPNLGLIPLLILWLGLGESPKVLMIALACFFPLYINTFAGIRNVDRRLIEVGNVYNFSGRQMLTRVVVPAALPQIFTGVRYGLGVAWLALVASELVGASTGLGYMIQMGQALSRVDIVMAGLVVFALAGKAVDQIVKLAERRFLRWRDAYVGV